MTDRARQLLDEIVTRVEELRGLLAPESTPVSMSVPGRSVQPGMDVADILNTTPPDVPIVFARGEYGPLLLPPHSGTGPRVLRLADPLPDHRLEPRAQPLAHFRSGSKDPAIRVVGGRYSLVGLEASGADPSGDIVIVGSAAATRVEDLPEAVAFDRCYVHGSGSGGHKRGVQAHGRDVAVRRSVVTDCKRDGQDAQAICIWNGGGPYAIVDCLLEASGENILIGGADSHIPDGVPSQIEITGNTIRKPSSWMAEPWDVKNLLELKNARGVCIRGNRLEGCWKKNQEGYAIVLTPRNQDGRNPWAVVEDVTIEGNLICDVSSGFNINGYDDEKGSQRTRGIRIRHNLVVASRARFGGDGRFLIIGGGPADVVVESNTAIVDGNAPVAFYGGKSPWQAIDGFVFRRNVFPHNAYGVFGDNAGPGLPTLTKYAPGAVFEGNVIGGARAAQYPAGNVTPPRADWESAFVNLAAGDYRPKPGIAWADAGADTARLP
jgi:hypothetical protein